MAQNNNKYKFNISLSVLNHLGRNLYRNFITILGEAISNSWDADSHNVWIDYNKDDNFFVIKDDGVGMTDSDFKEKFLKVGYSKRLKEKTHSRGGRPFIGGKGIGKLALLSCAERIHIGSKTSKTEYVGGVIDNKGLDKKIKGDKDQNDYELGALDLDVFGKYSDDYKKGTLIYFENLNKGVKNSHDFIRKSLALYFRFSLLDEDFNIYFNNEKVELNDLNDIFVETEFLWNVNKGDTDFTKELKNLKEKIDVKLENFSVNGFIASVRKPSFLNVFGAGEKTGIDLFVNGRLRETNILRHMPDFATRHIASYLYGQIHFDELDSDLSGHESFTTSRDAIKSNQEQYNNFLEAFKETISKTLSGQWDDWRRKHKEDGAADRNNIPLYQRKLEESKNHRGKDYEEKIEGMPLEKEIKESLKDKLDKLSEKNTAVYQDLFILENLFREYLKLKNISIKELTAKFPEDKEVARCIKKMNDTRSDRQIDESTHSLAKIVQEEHDLNYADFVYLGILLDKVNGAKTGRYQVPTMETHAKEILPIRNPVMHTNELSDEVMDWEKIKKIIDYVDDMVINLEPDA